MDYLTKGRQIVDLEIAELQRLRGRIDLPFGEAIEVLMEGLKNQRKVEWGRVASSAGRSRPR
jgi:hypothetical protein